MSYTISEVKTLQSQFIQLVRNVSRDMLTMHKAGAFENTRKNYPLVINELTGEEINFEFIFRGNPLAELFKTRDAETIDMNVRRYNGVATATTFIQGKPWALTYQQEDFDREIEEALSDPAVENVGLHLLDNVVFGMANAWYHHGLRDRIVLLNQESNFAAITDQFNGLITAKWDDLGYDIAVFKQESGDVDPVLLQRNISYDATPLTFETFNRNVDICQRYLDKGIVSLIALEQIEQGFTWSMV